MTEHSTDKSCLEIYKLHAEFADNVSSRREGANRLYAGLLTGFAGAVLAIFGFGAANGPNDAVLTMGGILGMALSVSWFFVIRSYRQLNDAKYKLLKELERELPFQFYEREWDLLEEGKRAQSYWQLTKAESILPAIVLVLSVAFIVWVLCW